MAEQNFLDFINSDPDRLAFLQRGMRNQNMGQQPFAQPFRRTATTIGNNIGGFGAQGLPLGLSTLNQILASQGRIDPRSRNRTLTSVGRNTEAQQTRNQQSFAQRGLQNSGAAAALDAAIGAAGADRAAAVDASFTQQEEQQKRDDILLMLQTLINPGLQGANIAAGLSAQNIQTDAARNQGNQQAAMALLSLLATSCWVARSIYGADNPKWLMARHYVLHIAPSWFRRAYLKHGEGFAAWLDSHAWAKPFVKPVFDAMVARASYDLVEA